MDGGVYPRDKGGQTFHQRGSGNTKGRGAKYSQSEHWGGGPHAKAWGLPSPWGDLDPLLCLGIEKVMYEV